MQKTLQEKSPINVYFRTGRSFISTVFFFAETTQADFGFLDWMAHTALQSGFAAACDLERGIAVLPTVTSLSLACVARDKA